MRCRPLRGLGFLIIKPILGLAPRLYAVARFAGFATSLQLMISAGVAHLVDRAVAIAWLKVDRTHSVFDCFNFEAVFQGVKD